MSNRDPSPVAVTSRSFSRHEVLRGELLERYENVTFNDEGLSLRGRALVDFLAGHQLAITALEPIDEEVLAALPELRVISKVGVGIDMLDLEAMRRRGVRLGWAQGTNARSVAELALAFMLALLRSLPAASRQVREGGWRQIQGRTLSGRSVGIVGFGHVGRDLAELLGSFGCEVLASDLAAIERLPAHVRQVEIDELLSSSEIVTLHLALSESTRGWFGAERLSEMRQGALLVNTSRGGLVDEDALYDAISRGHLAGAALDVFSTEPPGEHPLLGLDEVIVTPHIGGSTQEAVLAMGRAAIDGLSTATEVLAPS